MGETFPNPDAMPGLQQDDPALDEPLEFTQRTYNEISARFLYFETICHDLNAAKEKLHTELAARDQEVRVLQATVNGLANRIKELESSPPSSSSAPNPRNEPKIPDPPVFNGERKSLLPFLAKCRLKFAGQPSSFPTESNKVIYAGSRLEGPPFSWFSPLNDRLQDPERKDPPELASFDALAKALTTLYGDPHLALTAERKIRALRQVTSIAQYIAEFEEHRQYLTWNEDALRDQFYLGLKDRIKDNLAPLERPSTLTELKELALRLDSRLDARWHEKRAAENAAGNAPTGNTSAASRPWNNRSPTAPPPQNMSSSNSPPPAKPMNAAPPRPAANVNATPRLNFPLQSPDGTVPMEINSRGGYRLTQEEKDYRRANNLCGYCAAAGHTAFHCPVAPPMRDPFNQPPRQQQQRRAFANHIDVTDPSTIVPSPSPSSFSTGSQDTPDSENSYTRE
jgi:hypothetical protein